MDKDIWLYSWDDECFGSNEYESREEAIQGAKEELKRFGEVKRWVYIGKKEEAYIPCLDAENILDYVQDRINDEFGEFGESWSSYIKDEDEKILDDRLNEVFENWINEFGYKPDWCMVVDVEEVELNEGKSEGSKVDNN
ncbi:TPA: hypothetical protein MJC92_000236 [Clostridioides difficile]|uniref:hypothetical protein n=1 Tax=Clostridioides difficile TaxID=1496 RepID=UPI00038DA55C|nr:hypothetical protein [Clostridioides difficile]EQG35320.1 hypothetical protein QIK_3942 [Clostridioides difficile DA00126]EQG92207.1 hypothetical protein QKK_2026 [Clostridioides difficile DA00191]MBY1307216.1 hypothetical protein [Clostridioides difficile]MCL1007220.1 hypothetical protein [Clostridioides difficile]MCR1601216.1 hypothetical protein [Clostridioides difficile]